MTKDADLDRRREEFWNGFLREFESYIARPEHSASNLTVPRPTDGPSMEFTVGGECRVFARAPAPDMPGKIEVAFAPRGKEKEKVFAALKERRREIDRQLIGDAVWGDPDQSTVMRYWIRVSKHEDFDHGIKQRWQQQQQWLVEHAVNFHRVFSKYVPPLLEKFRS